MGHLRLTIGYLKATVIHIRVTLGHLRVTIGNFFSELHPKVRQTCYSLNKITSVFYDINRKRMTITVNRFSLEYHNNVSLDQSGSAVQ